MKAGCDSGLKRRYRSCLWIELVARVLIYWCGNPRGEQLSVFQVLKEFTDQHGQEQWICCIQVFLPSPCFPEKIVPFPSDLLWCCWSQRWLGMSAASLRVKPVMGLGGSHRPWAAAPCSVLRWAPFAQKPGS